MSREMEELKPCPFCGGSNLDVDHWCVMPDNYHAARVICNDCELDGPTSLSLPEPDGCWTPDEASAKEAGVKAWNRRQQAPAEHAAETVACPTCNGEGCRVAPLDIILTCPHCDGSGKSPAPPDQNQGQRSA